MMVTNRATAKGTPSVSTSEQSSRTDVILTSLVKAADALEKAAKVLPLGDMRSESIRLMKQMDRWVEEYREE